MGPEWIIVGIVAVVVIFGAKKAPEIARSLGRSQSEFKKGLRDGAKDLDEEEKSEKAETKSDSSVEPPD